MYNLFRNVTKIKNVSSVASNTKLIDLNFRYLNTTAIRSIQEAGCPAHDVEKKATDAWSAKCHVDKETWDKAKPFSEMPGLKDIPIIGNTWRFLPGGKYYNLPVMDFFDKFQGEFGNIARIEGVLGQENRVFLTSADDVELVYKQEAVMPIRTILGSMTYFREHFRQEVFKDAGGLVTSNGQAWYVFRNKVNKIMMQPKAVRQYITPIDAVCKEFVEKIRKLRKPDGTVGDIIMQTISKWALETVSCMALDQKLGCLDDNLPADSVPYKLMKNAEAVFKTSELLDFRPSLWRYFPTRNYRKGMKLYDEQITLAQTEIIKSMDRIKAQRAAGGAEADKEKSILEKLWDVDPKVATVMVSDMILAGIDTTSTAFVNVLYLLSTNPEKQDKLREEILSQLPDKNAEITSEDLSNMPYLKACVKEAGRIYPVTPGTMRNLTKDTVLSGYQIPKGKRMLLLHMFFSTKPEFFPRPLEFIPERWLRENDTELSYKHVHPFATMQFGFGSRSCIGRRFAELEIELALINVVKSFNLTWQGDPPGRYTTSLNYLSPPFGFIFSERK